jgi:hypothetical protein
LVVARDIVCDSSSFSLRTVVSLISDWFTPHRFRRTVAPTPAKIGCVAIVLALLLLVVVFVILCSSSRL